VPYQNWVHPVASPTGKLTLLATLEAIQKLSTAEGAVRTVVKPDVVIGCVAKALESTGGRLTLIASALPLSVSTADKSRLGFLSHGPVPAALRSPCTAEEKVNS
jgi:hypothetical protein